MSRQENNLRGQAAIRFAKEMGFSVDKIKPILKNLVKLYDNNWEFIEEDGYKALLDALLDPDEEPVQKKQKTDQVSFGSSGHRTNQGSINGSASIDNISPRSVSFAVPAPNCTPQRNSNVPLKVPKAEPGIEHDSVLLDSNVDVRVYVPIAVIHPSSARAIEYTVRQNPVPITTFENSVEENVSSMPGNVMDVLGSQSHVSNQVENGNNKKVNRADSNAMVSSAHEIASTARNEVKLSLTCDPSLHQNGFHMPDLDMILQHVETKCLRSLKLIDPSFSLKMLMQEICNSVLDLGTKDKVSNEEDGCVKVTTDLEPLKSHMPLDAHPDNLVRASEPPCNEPTFLDLSCNDNNIGTLEVQSLAIVQHGDFSIEGIRPLHHDVNDISKGEETVPVSIVNELCSEPYPPLFYYISKNMIHQSAFVNISLSRIGDGDCCPDCYGDCLSSSNLCACAREPEREYAYTLEGLLKKEFLDDCVSINREPHKHPRFYCEVCPLERTKNREFPGPCKGHLIRKFIKECWSKCGCSKQCGNRVVQRGISCNLQVFFTQDGKGWGLRTLDELPQGTFVCEYVGEILTNSELHERNVGSYDNEKHNHPVLLDADWCSDDVLKDEDALCLDATFYGNVARFINHRCSDATLVEIPVEVETPDRHYYHLAFFTARKVEPLEELTWDYGIDFEDVEQSVKAFRCKCGSECCRDAKRPAGRSKRPRPPLSFASNPTGQN